MKGNTNEVYIYIKKYCVLGSSPKTNLAKKRKASRNFVKCLIFFIICHMRLICDSRQSSSQRGSGVQKQFRGLRKIIKKGFGRNHMNLQIISKFLSPPQENSGKYKEIPRALGSFWKFQDITEISLCFQGSLISCNIPTTYEEVPKFSRMLWRPRWIFRNSGKIRYT